MGIKSPVAASLAGSATGKNCRCHGYSVKKNKTWTGKKRVSNTKRRKNHSVRNAVRKKFIGQAIVVAQPLFFIIP